MPGFDGKVKDGVLDWKAPKGEWRLIAAFCGKTLQKVKRAAPGGEGYVMDHFSARAVRNYLGRFERAFSGHAAGTTRLAATAYPHHFFNDSYEVYKADWTAGLFDEFFARRGYKLEEHLPEFLAEGERTEAARRIIPIIVKRLLNFSRRILPASGPNGRIGTVPKPVIRHMALPEI